MTRSPTRGSQDSPPALPRRLSIAFGRATLVGDLLFRAACHLWAMQTVYEAAGGADGLRRLASPWHARVMADEVVSHAFSHGFNPDHSQRLADYWAEALGGPTTYSDRYGDETSVVRMQSGNGPHAEMDCRAIACFDQALADAHLASDDRLRQILHDYFEWATTTTMSRYHHSEDDVPDGLRIPQWSWDGLIMGS
jgi:hemoglobin